MKHLAVVAVALLAVPTFAHAQESGRGAPVNVVNTPSVTVTNTPTNPVPVDVTSTKVTHLGRRPADHVTLGVASGTGDSCPTGWSGFVQRTQDGSFANFFTVPAGKALILTDFGFYAGKATNATWAVGDLLTVQMRRANEFGTLWQTSIVLDSATAAATRVHIREHLTSGIVFRAGQTPCSRVGFGTDAQGAGANGNTLSVVHGYLVDE